MSAGRHVSCVSMSCASYCQGDRPYQPPESLQQGFVSTGRRLAFSWVLMLAPAHGTNHLALAQIFRHYFPLVLRLDCTCVARRRETWSSSPDRLGSWLRQIWQTLSGCPACLPLPTRWKCKPTCHFARVYRVLVLDLQRRLKVRFILQILMASAQCGSVGMMHLRVCSFTEA